MKPTTSYFHLLDAVRGVAALIVLLRHTSYLFGWSLPVSHLAVDLFFMLSGAVVANAYEQRLREGLPLREFMLIRLVRLYPFYLLGSAIGLLPVLAARAGLSTQALPGNLAWTLLSAGLMVPTMNGDDLFPLDTPAWSLFFELVANFFYALMLRHLNRQVLATLILICACGLAVSVGVSPHHTLHGGYSSVTLPVGAFRVGFSFLVGVWLYRSLAGSRLAGTTARAGDGLRALALLGVVAATLAASPPGTLRPAYELLSVTLLFPVLIGLAMRCRLTGPAASIATLLGTLSYPVYMLHVPVARTLNGVLSRGLHLPVEQWLPWPGAVFLLVFLPACLLADRWYDRPVRARLAGLTLGRFGKQPG